MTSLERNLLSVTIAIATTFFAAVQCEATLIFEADFSGAGTGTGPGNLVNSGGTGSLTGLGTGTQTVGSTPTMGNGNFLHVDVPASGGVAGGVSFTPTSSVNSWNAMVAGGSGSTVLFNGAVDWFVRMDSAFATDNFNQIDVGGGAGNLRIILGAWTSNRLLIQLQTPGTGSIDLLSNTGSSGSTAPANNLSLFNAGGSIAGGWTVGTTYHLGFTWETDANTGIVAQKIFLRPDAGEIDTTVNTWLLSEATYTLDANLITGGLPTGAWLFGSSRTAGAKIADYDMLRLYNSAPDTFAAVPEPGMAMLALFGAGLLFCSGRYPRRRN